MARLFPALAGLTQVVLLEAAPRLLSPFPSDLSEYAEGHLREIGVDVRCGTAVTAVESAGRAAITAVKNFQPVKGAPAEKLEFGAIVWAAGITTRPIVRDLAAAIGPAAGQTSRRGIEVDHCLRVKGIPDGSVYALGDCAVSGSPPTAQVASQQGKYLGDVLRDGRQVRSPWLVRAVVASPRPSPPAPSPLTPPQA